MKQSFCRIPNNKNIDRLDYMTVFNACAINNRKLCVTFGKKFIRVISFRSVLLRQTICNIYLYDIFKFFTIFTLYPFKFL